MDKWSSKVTRDRIVKYRQNTLDNLNKLKKHSGEFNKPQVIKVTDGIHVAVGYALANSILIEAPEGNIIIDTVESMESATLIHKEFRKINQKPVVAIIYTHNHADHVNGAEAFLKSNPENVTVQIWAHESLMKIHALTNEINGPITYMRAMRQFGALIPSDKENTNSGIGISLKFGKEQSKIGFIPPNKFLKSDFAEVKIAGLKLQLLHVPGETDDQIAVYWADKKSLFCADDLYRAFPNLYAIRGTPFRSLDLWAQSLDTMRHLNAEFLVPSHTKPLTGKKEIHDIFLAYRDAVQYVHDQTVRWINQGLHPDTIANIVSLPDKLRNHPFLQEFYGTVAWSVKGLFSGYLGWFSGDAEELDPLTPETEAELLIELAGGEDAILEKAETALTSDNTQWALKLSAAALRVNEKSIKAKEIKTKALFDMASKQISANGYNYYTTVAYEEMGEVNVEPRQDVRERTIMTSSLRTLFTYMRYKVKAEECNTVDKIVEFTFTDVNEIIKFQLRQGLMDLQHSTRTKPDITVKLSSHLWRQMMAGQQGKALLETVTGGIEVKPGLLDFREVMNCFEKN